MIVDWCKGRKQQWRDSGRVARAWPFELRMQSDRILNLKKNKLKTKKIKTKLKKNKWGKQEKKCSQQSVCRNLLRSGYPGTILSGNAVVLSFLLEFIHEYDTFTLFLAQ